MLEMATHRALSGIGKSIVRLLAEKCPKTDFRGTKFNLCQPSDFRRSSRIPFGVLVCLYRVSFDTTQRVRPGSPFAFTQISSSSISNDCDKTQLSRSSSVRCVEHTLGQVSR